MEFAKIMDAKRFSTYEELFRNQFPDARVEEEFVSPHLSRFHVALGNIHFSESGIRDLAFKYALEESKGMKIPERIEQLSLDLK